jgi:prephenate dehydratase
MTARDTTDTAGATRTASGQPPKYAAVIASAAVGTKWAADTVGTVTNDAARNRTL